MTLGLHVWKLKESANTFDHILVMSNKKATTFTGNDLTEKQGMKMSEIFPTLINTEIPSMYREVALSGKPVYLGEFPFEDSIIGKSFFEVNAFALPDKMVGVLFENITEKKKASEQLKELNTELMEKSRVLENSLEQLQLMQQNLLETEKLAALGETVGVITHEINTPVGVAVTAASSLQEQSETLKKLYENKQLKQSTLLEFLSHIDEGSKLVLNNLQKAVVLIQYFKSVSTRQLSGKREKFDLCELIRQVKNMMQPSFKNTEIAMVLNLPEKIILDNYPGIFAQILINFITNSLKHGFSNKHKQGQINLHLTREDDFIKIIYSDNGIGISQELLPKVFDPFFTTTINAGGSGLGLSIAKKKQSNTKLK
jgi:signal transduction histidine kinase